MTQKGSLGIARCFIILHFVGDSNFLLFARLIGCHAASEHDLYASDLAKHLYLAPCISYTPHLSSLSSIFCIKILLWLFIASCHIEICRHHWSLCCKRHCGTGLKAISALNYAYLVAHVEWYSSFIVVDSLQYCHSTYSCQSHVCETPYACEETHRLCNYAVSHWGVFINHHILCLADILRHVLVINFRGWNKWIFLQEQGSLVNSKWSKTRFNHPR